MLTAIFVLILLPVFAFSNPTSVSIYEIQYTNNPGVDNTYPSPYRDQIVTTQGIVTAVDFVNKGFYLSERESGAWRGVFVHSVNRELKIGDELILTGEVFEHFGFTTIKNARQVRIISRSNQLPPPVLVATNECAVSEAYEGVLIQISDVTIVGNSPHKNVILANDGSGVCRIVRGFLSERNEKSMLVQGESFLRIVGIVDYRFGEYRINARNSSDLTLSPVGVNKPSWGRIKTLYR